MMGNEVYDLLIIGSGPAGMGAAVYAARAGLKAAVIDRSPVSGGQVQSTYEVDNYLGLPGLSGFVAEMTIFVGSFQNDDTFHRVCTLVTTTSIVITAVIL